MLTFLMLNVNLVGGCAGFQPGRPSGESFIQAHRRYPESRLRRLLGFRHR